MNNGTIATICADGIFISNRVRYFSESDYYVIKLKTGYKIGVVRSIDNEGNFTLKSGRKDKSIYPN